MHAIRAVAALIAMGAGISPLAHADTNDEIAQMRAELKALRESYEARIGALERKLQEAEAHAAAAPLPAPPAPSTAPGPSAFNPAISTVLQGSYANRTHGPDRGFSLAESEITLSANVDERFAGALTASLTPEDTVSVEEAYGVYTGAPYGLVPKFGRFLSGIGYLNEQHAHAWDFIDAPLAYQAFLGGNYRTDGLQVKWVAPTELFLELGGEAGRGGEFPGVARDKNGIGSAAGYLHLGGDVGDSHSWRAGVSYLDPGSASSIRMADFVWKWAPDGNGVERNAKVQGEYFRQPGSAASSGYYVQGVYQFMPRWRVGLRYDRLDTPGEAFDSRRASAMVDWSPSEFSRFRLQLQRAQLMPDRTDNELFVQYILTLGAHGAHKY